MATKVGPTCRTRAITSTTIAIEDLCISLLLNLCWHRKLSWLEGRPNMSKLYRFAQPTFCPQQETQGETLSVPEPPTTRIHQNAWFFRKDSTAEFGFFSQANDPIWGMDVEAKPQQSICKRLQRFQLRRKILAREHEKYQDKNQSLPKSLDQSAAWSSSAARDSTVEKKTSCSQVTWAVQEWQ